MGANVTQKMWFGGIGRFGVARNWTPNGVPHSGDTAVVQGGEMQVLGGSTDGVIINLGTTDPASAPTLFARNATIGSVNVLAPSGPPYNYGEYYANMEISGRVVEKGSVTVGLGIGHDYGFGKPADLNISLA